MALVSDFVTHKTIYVLELTQRLHNANTAANMQWCKRIRIVATSYMDTRFLLSRATRLRRVWVYTQRDDRHLLNNRTRMQDAAQAVKSYFLSRPTFGLLRDCWESKLQPRMVFRHPPNKKMRTNAAMQKDTCSCAILMLIRRRPKIYTYIYIYIHISHICLHTWWYCCYVC
jgi:hypothetical protein